jgi:hypothetical protein
VNVSDLKLIISNDTTNEDDFINAIGTYIDTVAEQDLLAETLFAIEQLNKFENKITRQNRSLFHYYLAVAYADVYHKTIVKTEKEWAWEQELAEKELLNLRLALQNISSETDVQIVANIHTNLGNRFNTSGRFLLAYDSWNKAFGNNLNVGMPLINIGNSLMYYGLNYINETKYRGAYIQLAYQYFKLGVSKVTDLTIKKQIDQYILHIEKEYKKYLDYRFRKNDFTDGLKSGAYKKWCIKHSLCLNPLSNLSNTILSDRDDIQLNHENKDFTDFFVSLKNDYDFCRKQFFKSTTEKDAIAAEQIKKSSFISAYSILDKTSYLMSGILNLNDKISTRLNFNTIWYQNFDKKQGVKKEFTEKKDLMLRALYWTSKDIYLNEKGFRSIIEPQAKEINKIRNFIEHKSFRFGEKNDSGYTLQIPIDEFNVVMINLLKLVRESLIYTAYLKRTN